MLATCISISGGMRLLSLTKASKTDCTLRTSASSSTVFSDCSSTSSTSTTKNCWPGSPRSGCSPRTNWRTRARFTPSTRTLTVPSGSGSSWMT